MQESSLRNLSQRRRVVVHHMHLLPAQWQSQLKPHDIVFFDDCLFSQWIWLKKSLEFMSSNSIDCILGFSSGLYAAEDAKQIYAVESQVLHDACNKATPTLRDADSRRSSLPEMSGFMKVSQLKELLELPFCHLALHGCCHLKLQDSDASNSHQDLLKMMQLFKADLNSGLARLGELGLQTKMFVYPYVYSFFASDACLKRAGFTCIVGSGASQLFRISIEDLLSGKTDCDS